jgi:hypothetical protein
MRSATEQLDQKIAHVRRLARPGLDELLPCSSSAIHRLALNSLPPTPTRGSTGRFACCSRPLGRVDRPRLDRQAVQHQESRSAVQNGDHGGQVHHLHHHNEVAGGAERFRVGLYRKTRSGRPSDTRLLEARPMIGETFDAVILGGGNAGIGVMDWSAAAASRSR